jgi:TonB-linked SusC/RagA family outer membrane protein
MRKAYYIIISSFFLLFFLVGNVNAQTTVVRGKVISSSDKLPLIGVSVIEKNKDNRVVTGAKTDLNGEFVFKVVNKTDRLDFSYIGYKSTSRPIGNTTTFSVVLQDIENSLGQIEVVADKQASYNNLGIKERDITTAVQKISAKDFEGLAVSSIEDALQGRVAGLDIVANSGEPGAGMSMRIRGTTTLTGSAEPLIVVNGVPYETTIDKNFDFSTASSEQYASLISVSPNDIEDITILKDAAACAVWGSKGANGVLVINTKKGVRGKTRVNYSYKLYVSEMPKTLKLLNGDQYTMMMKEAILNPRLQQEIHNELDYNPSFSEYQEYNNNTDWVKAVTQTGFKNEHNLAISGGGDRARYRISNTYTDQTGIIIGQRLRVFTNRSTLDYNVSDRMLFTTDFAYTYTNNDKNYLTSNDDNQVLGIAMRKMPNLSIYDQDANGNNTSKYYNILASSQINSAQKYLVNPVALIHDAKNNSIGNRINPTFRLRYDILDPQKCILRYWGYVSFDVNNNKDSNFYPKELVSDVWANSLVNSSMEVQNLYLGISSENSILFSPVFVNKDHDFHLSASIQMGQNKSSRDAIYSYGHPDSGLKDASADAYLAALATGSGSGRSLGYVFQSQYKFKNRYNIAATVRVDGNSNFSPQNRWGTFPSLSGSWIMSDETFMKPLEKVINFMTFKGSYGISGKAPEYANYYGVYSTYGTAYAGSSAVFPSNIILNNLKWEKNENWNAGFDLNFFDNKITTAFNYYSGTRKDMLTKNVSIPSSSGFTSIGYANTGALKYNGWEITINGNKLIKVGDFSVDLNFNFANSSNILTEISPLLALTSGNPLNNGEYMSITQVGNPIGSFYGYKYQGVYAYSKYIPSKQEDAPIARDARGNPILDKNGVPKAMYMGFGSTNYIFQGGDAKYEDINHDGSIDKQDVVYLGRINPKLTGGIGTVMRFKNLSLNLFFNYRYGNKIINISRMNMENMYTYDNQSVAVNWRWRKDGDITNMPRALYQTGYNWLGSDRYVEDGSFIRLKYVSIGYAAPQKILKLVGLTELKLYCTIQNLLTFTNYTGLDPEVNLNDGRDASRTPVSRNVTFTLSVGL